MTSHPQSPLEPEKAGCCEDGLETGTIVTVRDALAIINAIKKYIPTEATHKLGINMEEGKG
jgi:hypothetical protein